MTEPIKKATSKAGGSYSRPHGGKPGEHGQTPNPLSISYRAAAKELGDVTHHQVRLVALGMRKSESLSKRLEPYLVELESGIGSN